MERREYCASFNSRYLWKWVFHICYCWWFKASAKIWFNFFTLRVPNLALIQRLPSLFAVSHPMAKAISTRSLCQPLDFLGHICSFAPDGEDYQACQSPTNGCWSHVTNKSSRRPYTKAKQLWLCPFAHLRPFRSR